MKLALISPYPPSKGTLNEYAFHLVQQLKNKPDLEELIIISDELPEGESYPEITDGSVKIRFMEVWKFNSYRNPIRILKAIKQSGADCAFFNIQFLSFGDKKIAATLGLLLPMLTRLSGIPSTVLLHNIIETVDYESAGITKNPILKWIFNLSGTILTMLILRANIVAVTIAKYVDILEKKYKAKNVALVPHGSFELPPLPNFNPKQDRKNIMTFGKFGTYKKVEKLIEAVEVVRQITGEKIDLVIAGTDNPNVAGYLDGVKKKYAHVPDITFTGYVEEEDVPRIFGDSTFTVFPYTSTTGSSGVLHQAGSYGKAAVLPNIGDLKELIEEEGYKGEYFIPEDVPSMAKAIEKLIVDEDHRVGIAKQNYAAAASLPLEDITDWYMMHFHRIAKLKSGKVKNVSPKKTRVITSKAV